ncbi:MAG TPA: hypothetical protein VG713_15065 [Pirellulales bacterium]|nr:hypothetical protein [Pirellulales bacterium]
MNIARVAFATLLLLASLAFVFLAAKTLKLRGAWAAALAKLEGDPQKNQPGLIASIEQQNEQLADGDQVAQNTPLRPDEGRSIEQQFKDEKAGVRQYSTALHDMLVDRGRVWDQARRGQVDPENGNVTVSIAEPTPHAIRSGSILYAFEKAPLNNPDAPTSGQYLGEFKVTAVDKQSVTLAPTQRIVPADQLGGRADRQLEKLKNSQADWVLYETMPADRHAAFTGLGEADLAKLVPLSSRPQYLNDGREAPPETPPDQLSRVWVPNTEGRGKYDLDPGKQNQAGEPADADFKPNPAGAGNYDLLEGKYVDGKFVAGKFYDRPLRDYSTALRELHRELWAVRDAVAAMSVEAKSIQDAVAGLTGPGGQVENRDKEIAALQEDLKRVTAERDLVEKHSTALKTQLATVQQTIDRLLKENRQLADQWTSAQLEAARQVDALTESASAAAR